MTKEKILVVQESNLYTCYKRAGEETGALSELIESWTRGKKEVFPELGEDLTILLERRLSHEEIVSLNGLEDIVETSCYSSWKFNFSSMTATRRETGVMEKIEKVLLLYDLERVQESEKVTRFVISANPIFLLGSSVGREGRPIDSSCHHPESNTNGYKTGPVSYAIDRVTLMGGELDREGNLVGRILFHYNREVGVLYSMRHYGSISTGKRRFLVKHLNSIFDAELENTDDIYQNYYYNSFRGYTDNSYGKVYFDLKIYDRPYDVPWHEMRLAAPVCIGCGKDTYNTLNCETCNPPKLRCWECDEEIPRDEEVTYRGRHYCSVCEPDLVVCRCGVTVERHERISTIVIFNSTFYTVEGCPVCVAAASCGELSSYRYNTDLVREYITDKDNFNQFVL